MNITDDTKIELIKPMDVTDLAGDKVMIDFETGKYYMLKGSAVDIWTNIQEPTTVLDVKNALLNIYDVDEEECMNSIVSFLSQMQENHFITLE